MSVDDAQRAAPVVVQRWKRYGHDRAYVKVGDQDLGYRDLKTGSVHCDRPELIDTVTRATDALLDRARAVAAAQAYVPRHGDPGDTPPAVEPAPRITMPEAAVALLPDRDLALNRPGQAVRQIATELRDAAPVRTFLARMVGAKTDERAHRIGADGEVEVARRLERLGPQWKVLHAVPVGERGSDIDHVVIGPGGVFTVNAKNHPQANVWVAGDTVKVNGYNQPYVRNSRHEARRAAKLLTAAAGFDVEVCGIVAIMGAHRGFTVKEQPRDRIVSVIARRQVEAHLRAMPAVLGTPSIERIYDVARHLATWHPATVRRDDFTATW
jgi:hypothetical protein